MNRATEQPMGVGSGVPLLSDSIHNLSHGEKLLHAIRDEKGRAHGSIAVEFAITCEGYRYDVRVREPRSLGGAVDWDRSANLFTPHAAADFAYRMMRAVLKAS